VDSPSEFKKKKRAARPAFFVLPHILKETFEELLVMAGEDNMVIADGVGKKIAGL